jgi:hypothetical protein
LVIGNEAIMALISTTEVKNYLNISSTTYDTLIGLYLEPCLYDVFDYTNNYFENNAVRLISGQYTFSTTGTIVVDGTNFSTYSFQSGDDIRVKASKRNDGIYIAGTVSSATVTISTEYVYGTTLKEETEEATIEIVKMDFPASLKMTVSQMIKFRIDHITGTPQSENLGDYGVTYGGIDYPKSITDSLNKYRLVKFI